MNDQEDVPTLPGLAKESERLSNRVSRLQRGFLRFSRRVFVILAIVAVGMVASGGFNYYFLVENGNRIDEAKRLGDEARRLGEAINTERALNTLSACLESNSRYDDAVEVLDRRFAAMTPAQRAAAAEGREFSIELIRAVAPKRDCVALVKERVREPRSRR